MLSAASTPMRRGRRCVPPAPGSSPSFTSGSARLRARASRRGSGRRARAPGRRPCRCRRSPRSRACCRSSTARSTREQVRLRVGLRRAEFADVGAAGEALAGADHDHRAHRRVGLGARERADDQPARSSRPRLLTGGLSRRRTRDPVPDLELQLAHTPTRIPGDPAACVLLPAAARRARTSRAGSPRRCADRPGTSRSGSPGMPMPWNGASKATWK